MLGEFGEQVVDRGGEVEQAVVVRGQTGAGAAQTVNTRQTPLSKLKPSTAPSLIHGAHHDLHQNTHSVDLAHEIIISVWGKA